MNFKLRRNFSEDSWAVFIAAFLLLLVIAIALVMPGFKFSIPAYKWANFADLQQHVFSFNNVVLFLLGGLLLLLLTATAVFFSGEKLSQFIPGFLLLYVFAIVSLIAAGNSAVNSYGIEYVIFALLTGLLLNNLFTLPVWVRSAAKSEFFIKTGLVILGSSVLFTDIVKAGLPGVLQAILVVAVVWFFAVWLSRKLKVDDEFAVILASAVSICGVSAAIVAAGAIQADKKKLSYVTTLVLVVAIPMMLLQPWIVGRFGIPELVAGAWMGGTLDTTASVAAATEIVGAQATKVGVIVKFSQNVLIGVAAFLIASWWVVKNNKGRSEGEKPGFNSIWQRFPKFVLGFIAVSLVFSFVLQPALSKQVSPVLNSIRSVWFALAFVSIGIEARFSDMLKTQGGRPAAAFIGAQLFNILWTLLIAYLLFGGKILPAPIIQ
ncbi:MAG: putative sulfate exporter family transporter [Chitinophagaceae bacterium]|nr:putative sulfate exporter family transporter [Chitinophagaceae bacterium]